MSRWSLPSIVAVAVLVVLAAAACGSGSSAPSVHGASDQDAGATAPSGDAGPASLDAGFTVDAGPIPDGGPPPDAGPAPDAGATDAGLAPDAGSQVDAGSQLDAGTPGDAGAAPDAGSTADAGPPPPDGGPPGPTRYTAHIDCSPVNDFGYVGSVNGDLDIGARKDGVLTVVGTLQLRYHLVSDPETVRTAQVAGTIHNTGEYVSVRVLSGADDLDSLYLVFAPYNPEAPGSAIHSSAGDTSYQTDCSASTAVVPQGADLRADGWMTLQLGQAPGGGTLARIAVQNVGNQPAKGVRGRVGVGFLTVDAELHPSTDVAGTQPKTLDPEERGYLQVVLPGNPYDRCTQVGVVLDVDRAFQSGDPDPYLDDAVTVTTPCLGWSSPITEQTLGIVPHPLVDGYSLQDIVGSFHVARADGNLCSQCHYQTAHGRSYAPPVAQGGSARIGPTDVVSGGTWASDWAPRFLTTPGDSGTGKPKHLTDAFRQWLGDGSRP